MDYFNSFYFSLQLILKYKDLSLKDRSIILQQSRYCVSSYKDEITPESRRSVFFCLDHD